MTNIGRLLKKADNQLTKKFDQFAAQYDLTGTQMSIIDFLSRHSDQTTSQKAIEIEFNIKRSTTTVLLQRMEKKSLVRRFDSTTDARKKMVVLTDKSKILTDRINQYMTQQQELLADHFSSADIKTFEKMLQFYIHQN